MSGRGSRAGRLQGSGSLSGAASALIRVTVSVLTLGLAALTIAPSIVRAQKATPARTTTKPVATIKELMTGLIDPSADHVWGAVAVVESASGVEEKAPKTDAEWSAVRTHALTLAEAGNLLMLDGRAKDRRTWLAMSRALIDAGETAAHAAEKRDPSALLNAGEQVFSACALCHQAYWTEGPAGALAPLPPPPVRSPVVRPDPR
jgi:hypothetical protein